MDPAQIKEEYDSTLTYDIAKANRSLNPGLADNFQKYPFFGKNPMFDYNLSEKKQHPCLETF